MITEADRAELAELAMRALDRILTDYGDDAQLTAATLVFEVNCVSPKTGRRVFQTNYDSIARSASPHYTVGLLSGTVRHLTGR